MGAPLYFSVAALVATLCSPLSTWELKGEEGLTLMSAPSDCLLSVV